MHCPVRVTVVAAYCCIEEDNFTVSCKCCLISSSLFEASAVGVPSFHWLQLQCNRSILSLHVPLYMFVIAVFAASQLLVVVVFSARNEF